MGAAKHVLVLIHGITPERDPRVTEQYQEFLRAVRQRKLPFEQPVCEVSWGVPAPGGPITRPDQYLTPAEQFLASLVEQGEVEKIDVPENELSSLWHPDLGIPIVRQLFRRVRESVVQYGLADALYYAAPEGEKAIRDAVFEQVFANLDATDDSEVHLHIVAHSLGVTIAHDFLYALFGTHDPEYPKGTTRLEVPLDGSTKTKQDRWKQRARDKTLKLGTFLSFASQLPLFLVRKQALLERLAAQQRLDPRVIGIDPTRQHIQWAIFYDADELLGFPTRRLYTDTPAIHDIQINTGIEPLTAHLGYWRSKRVIERCLKILAESIAQANEERV